MHKKITILISIIFVFLLSSCNSERFDTQNTSLGYKISIGMDKENVDKLLGEPTASPSGFYYEYIDNLSIKYEYGKIKEVSIYGMNWVTEKQIKVGNSVEKVYETYGETEQITPSSDYAYLLTGQYMLNYYIDKKGNPCSITDSNRCITFWIKEETGNVKSISISDGYSK